MNPAAPGPLCLDSRKGLFWPLYFVAAALVMAACALMQRHLFLDGSAFLTEVLEKRQFTTFDAPRLFAHLVLEGPLWLAVRLGLSNLRALSWIYGLTLFLHPVLSLWACWRILRHRNASLMLLPALTWAGLTLTTSFFIISESWLGVSLFWPIYFLLLFQRHRLGWPLGLLMLAGAFTSIRVYEGFFIPGSLLLLLALRRLLWQWRRLRLDGWTLATALCLAASVACGLFWALHPRDLGNRVSLDKGFSDFLGYPPGPLLVLAALLLLLPRPRWLPSWITTLAGCAFLAWALHWGLLPWHSESSLMPNRQHDLRILNCLVPPALGLLPFLAAWLPCLRVTLDAQRKRLFLGFSCAVLLWQVGAATVWMDFTRTLATVLDTRAGMVPFEQTDLWRYRFDQCWSLPTLSILVRGLEGRPVRSVVLNPCYATWQPFDPRVRATLPPLQAYGVRYALEGSH